MGGGQYNQGRKKNHQCKRDGRKSKGGNRKNRLCMKSERGGMGGGGGAGRGGLTRV